MRLRRLSLERFGRFEGCDLAFRPGTPDLHVIYGPNEAGKTTSMAAVSDLLFGFEARSRYNFRFDYPLLRIGAEIEEDGRILHIRRRKANAGSLVDVDDRPMDEGPLAAMLHGQTRERFRLAFSLDHARLREGGRAIVQARDDVGQALFAAGSGMTGVVGALEALEAQADSIWAPRAAKHRSFTQSERSYDVSRAAARDRQVRPKVWVDARDAHLASERALREAEADRDALLAEQGRIERLRRVAPAMRRRAELLAVLADFADAKAMPAAREERVVAALDVIAAAERDGAAAATLLAEASDRLGEVPDDAAVLLLADVVDALAERRGAVAKGLTDAERLGIERRAKQLRVAGLRADVGLDGDALPSRAAISRMRELAKGYGEATAALRAAAETEEDSRARLQPLERKLADAVLTEGLEELIAAVDQARRLGEDVDARHSASKRAAASARDAVTNVLARLAPWTGSVDDLERMPQLAEVEIVAVETQLGRFRETERAAAEEVRRVEEELERLALDRVALAGQGQAVSAEDIEEARTRRDELWRDVREALGGVGQQGDAAATGDLYAVQVEAADILADRRFAFAEDSGRLGLLDKQAGEVSLRGRHSARRRDEAVAAEAVAAQAWMTRIEALGLPALDPGRLRAWLADGLLAIAAAKEASRLEMQAVLEGDRRDVVRTALLRSLVGWSSPDDRLAPVLIEAERRRTVGEEQALAYARDHAEHRQLTEALAELVRSNRRRMDDRLRIEGEWRDLQTSAGTSFAIVGGEDLLTALDELRVETDAMEALDTRMRGIEVDRRRFEEEVADLWNRVGGEGEPSFEGLRSRVAMARTTDQRRRDLMTERDRRSAEVDAASARRSAAVESLRPVVEELGGLAIEDLDGAVQTSRRVRGERDALAVAIAEIAAAGDGLAIEVIEQQWLASDPDQTAIRAAALVPLLADANAKVRAAAEEASAARIAFAALDLHGDAAAAAAAEAEEARAEMGVQAEAYLLRRSQALTLRWAIERHRRERQDPLLARAGGLFGRLTLGRYIDLRIDHDSATPRLLGIADGGGRAIDVDAMSEGTADQLFLALRLAAAEQSVAAGSRLPFLADDLFINFDDARARAGFEVLAELARSMQILFFTHHAHLADMAAEVVGVDMHSRCDLER